MRNTLLVFCAVAVAAGLNLLGGKTLSAQQSASTSSWVFLVADKNPPSVEENKPKSIPGSTKSFTMAQIDDLMNPPDWFPNAHPPAPSVVTNGQGAVIACGSCHLMSGLGHPESANLAGMSEDYIERQLADFKAGTRTDPAGRMNGISKGLSDEETVAVSRWFASLKPMPWVRVVETDTVPKTFVNKGRMRLPLAGTEMEPLGRRIIELPEDPDRTVRRDPRSGFIAYAPFGSLAKGENLVKTGGAGKTIQCSSCHGEDLTGLGEIPKIAGLSSIYIARQLYIFKGGTRNGKSAALMKSVVANLTDDDIISLAAYVASRKP